MRLVQLHVPIREVATEKLVDVSSSYTLVSGWGLDEYIPSGEWVGLR